MKITTTDGKTIEATDRGAAHLSDEDEAGAECLAEDLLAAAGRPLPAKLRGRRSLHGGKGSSPQVAFRIPEQVRQRAEQLAAQRGITVSQLAREALERELSA